MKLLMQNLPPSLKDQQQPLERCLCAMNAAMPLRAVYLFGSHVRAEARSDSDVDLCVVTDGAERQIEASRRLREAIWSIWPRPAFTLVPITPKRLAEKRACKDHFFQTILDQGVPLATEN